MNKYHKPEVDIEQIDPDALQIVAAYNLAYAKATIPLTERGLVIGLKCSAVGALTAVAGTALVTQILEQGKIGDDPTKKINRP